MKKRDYSQHHNHQDVKHQIIKKRPKKKRTAIKFLGLFLILLFVSFLIVFKTSLFEIKKIVISGSSDNQLVIEMESEIKEYIKNNKNIIFINIEKLQKHLISKIKLGDLKISKRYPESLEVDIKPVVPALLWQENGNFFLIDGEGWVETQVNFSQVKWDLPLVSRNTSTIVVIGEKLLPKETIEFIKEFYHLFYAKKINLKITKFIIPELTKEEVYIITDKGYLIMLNSKSQPDKIITNLKNLINEKFNEEPPTEYVDLRLEEKIFYK